MKNISRKIVAILILATSLSFAPAHAQQNAETAARQAEIDAGEADVRMRQIEKDALDTSAVEGIDAPEVGVDAAKANIQQRRIDNAEEREDQAEDQE